MISDDSMTRQLRSGNVIIAAAGDKSDCTACEGNSFREFSTGEWKSHFFISKSQLTKKTN
jgi:hypothetical protein